MSAKRARSKARPLHQRRANRRWSVRRVTEGMRLLAATLGAARRAELAGVSEHRWRTYYSAGNIPIARCACGVLAWLPRGAMALVFDVGGQVVVESPACFRKADES